MAYAPGITYMGPQILMAGVQRLGEGIRGATQEYVRQRDELRKELGESDTIVDFARQTGIMTDKEYDEYIKSNAKQKAGIANGLAKSWTMAHANQQLKQQKDMQEAQLKNALDVARIHAAAYTGKAAGPPQLFTVTNPQGEEEQYVIHGNTILPTMGTKTANLPDYSEGHYTGEPAYDTKGNAVGTWVITKSGPRIQNYPGYGTPQQRAFADILTEPPPAAGVGTDTTALGGGGGGFMDWMRYGRPGSIAAQQRPAPPPPPLPQLQPNPAVTAPLAAPGGGDLGINMPGVMGAPDFNRLRPPGGRTLPETRMAPLAPGPALIPPPARVGPVTGGANADLALTAAQVLADPESTAEEQAAARRVLGR